jgi:hypothetical protein
VPQIGRGCEGTRREIHLHPIEDREEIVALQMTPSHEIDELGLDSGTGIDDRPFDETAPAVESGAALLRREARLVDEIIDDTTEGIKDLHVATHVPRQDSEGKSEIRSAAADDLTGAGGRRVQR